MKLSGDICSTIYSSFLFFLFLLEVYQMVYKAHYQAQGKNNWGKETKVSLWMGGEKKKKQVN